MKVIFKISLVMTILLLASCQVTLRHEKIMPPTADRGVVIVPAQEGSVGLKYALPNTALRFCVTAEKVEKKRGVFYLYSERYLGLKDVILEDNIEWNIKSIEMTAYGVPSEHQYVVPMHVADVALFSLSESGLLLSINDKIEEEKSCMLVQEALKKKAVVPYTEEMLLANSTAKMAQEAARYIYRLRENKTALISSDLEVVPSDGDALGQSVEQIEALEKQFVALFAGTTECTKVKKVIEIVPEKLNEKQILFRFSSFKGLVAKDDLSGSPIYYELKELYSPEATSLPDSAGLYFVQPAKVNVSLYDGRQQILDKNVSVAQFGAINCLPKGYLNDEVKMRFYPSTGAIKSIYKK